MRASGEDFLGLGAELARGAHPPAPVSSQPVLGSRAVPALPRTGPEAAPPPVPRHAPQPAIPAQERLAPEQHLNAAWPDVRPNTWRVGPSRAGAAPVSGASDRASWLLELDDSAVPPAHPSFVPTSTPANASFRDGTEVGQRVAPWVVRALCVFAGLFLCAVVTRTIVARGSRAPLVPEAPVQPLARSATSARTELAAPGETDARPRARPGSRKQRPAPARAGAPAVGAASDPDSPALRVYDLPAAKSASLAPTPAAGADRREVEGWLAEHSRAAAPASDVGAIVAGGAVATPTATSASGIWEGATIPVEALEGGLRLQTPGVGRVRARLEGGARPEGRLTAIGQGRVWIETDAGPVEIESAKLRGLEQIAERPAAGAPRAPERQRVRTAGGVFYGRVLARDGRTVTLVTDAGTRLTVEADEIAEADPGEGS